MTKARRNIVIASRNVRRTAGAVKSTERRLLHRQLEARIALLEEQNALLLAQCGGRVPNGTANLAQSTPSQGDAANTPLQVDASNFVRSIALQDDAAHTRLSPLEQALATAGGAERLKTLVCEIKAYPEWVWNHRGKQAATKKGAACCDP